MRETSSLLFNLTQGRVQIRAVFIKLPSSWAPSCAPPTAARTAQWSAPDLVVGEDHPLLLDTPWTLQHDGCGHQGRNIELPASFANKNSSLEERAEILAKEWIKLKFGVFEEDGFAGDGLYPAMFEEGKQNIFNSGCVNKTQVSYSIQQYFI